MPFKNYTGNDVCRLILKKSCEYLKCNYLESDNDIVFIYDHKTKVYKIKHDLFDYIFVCYIRNNTNIDETVIMVSDYLKK